MHDNEMEVGPVDHTSSTVRERIVSAVLHWLPRGGYLSSKYRSVKKEHSPLLRTQMETQDRTLLAQIPSSMPSGGWRHSGR